MKVDYENSKLLENLQKNYEKLTKFYPEDQLFKDFLKRVNSSITKLKKESIVKNQF